MKPDGTMVHEKKRERQKRGMDIMAIQERISEDDMTFTDYSDEKEDSIFEGEIEISSSVNETQNKTNKRKESRLNINRYE